MISGNGDRDRIIEEFYQLDNDKYSSLWSFGFIYKSDLKEAAHYKTDITGIEEELKEHARELLDQIEKQEREISDFKISMLKA